MEIDWNIYQVENQSPQYPPRIIRNKTFTLHQDIVKQFNEHFINVGPNVAKSIKSTKNINRSGRLYKKFTCIKLCLVSIYKRIISFELSSDIYIVSLC